MDYIKELSDLLKEDWKEFLWATPESWEIVTEEVGDHNRWNTPVTVICKPVDEERFFAWWYEQGNTEVQEDYGPCEYGDPTIEEVYPKEITVTIYRPHVEHDSVDSM